MPFITRSSSTTSGFSTRIPLERGHAVLGFDHFVAGRSRGCGACSVAPGPNRRRAGLLRAHSLSMIACAMPLERNACVAQPRLDHRARHAVDHAAVFGFREDTARRAP